MSNYVASLRFQEGHTYWLFKGKDEESGDTPVKVRIILLFCGQRLRGFKNALTQPLTMLVGMAEKYKLLMDDNLFSQLYDLTSICEGIDGDDDKDEKGPGGGGGGSKNPFRVAVAMLLYR